ncbi:hypothetical protein LTS18_014992 [Coniosporium uncinatum]|uniref:Uncharacterized protein n=1 Tax=Coniosporium uncinatum TaxID=93489 RepID=A0ACC3DVJ9_9PEZI|nr:hypothetical protein LTS18_014992 [Coniosporium uncinatum]
MSDIGTGRNMMAMREAKWVKELGPISEKVKESYGEIAMSDGYASKCKIFQPTTPPPEGSPLVVLFFGGGFMFGTVEQCTGTARALVETYGAVVVNPSYRLAPEHPFPEGVNDGWDNLKHLATNAEKYGATPSAGFVVGGYSAGGAIAAVLAQRAKDEKLSPPLTGQLLSVPLIFHDTVPEEYREFFFSREQNAYAPGFNKMAYEGVLAALKPDFSSPLWSPVNATSGQEGLPPAYLQVCGMDPLRDDALIYEKMLNAAGVKTKLDLYPGVPHGFWMLHPMLASAKKAKKDDVNGIGWLLGA